MLEIDEHPVFFHPVKPIAEKLIQEKLIFSRKDLSGMTQVDYVNEMAMVTQDQGLAGFLV